MSELAHHPVRNQRNHSKGATSVTKILSIIIPTYNEEDSIATILEKIDNVTLLEGIHKEIIVVNDCSTDQTDTKIREFLIGHPNVNLNYLTHCKNLGKGAAIHTAIEHVAGDFVVIQDADLEYDPSEYNTLLEPILSGYADVVYGSRFMGGHPHRVLFFWHTWGNKLLTLFNNIFTNMNLTDAHTCYKLFPAYILRGLNLEEKQFAFDAELNVKVARIPSIRIYEVGIAYFGRTFAEGKKIRLKDAFISIWCLIKYTLLNRSDVTKRKSLPVPIQQA